MLKYIIVVTFLSVLKITAQDTLVTAVAEKGDGILSLLRKQGMNPYEVYDDFVALNIKNLRDSIHLYEGRHYQIPAVEIDTIANKQPVSSKNAALNKENRKTVALFGKKHAAVNIVSERLKGAVYYLVSGHGGPDPGAVANYGGKMISEDEYAYDVTLRLAKELIAHGATVYIIIKDENDGIRDGRILAIDRDEVAYPKLVIPLNQTARLKQRVTIVNELYAKNKGAFQRLIVTHVDSRSKGQNIDVFFYHHENSKNGKKLAESIHKTFKKKYKKYQPNRKYEGTFESRTSLYLVKNTIPAMAYIEIGNIRNQKDQRRILDFENREALAKWICEGVLLDFEIR